MAILTPKGSAESQVSGTTLTIPNVTVGYKDSLYVIVAYKHTDTPSSCKFGTRIMRRAGQRFDATLNFGYTLFNLRRIGSSEAADLTEDIVVTFSSAVTAKVMCAYTLDSMHTFDQIKRNLQANSTTPNTLYTNAEHIRSDSFALGGLVANGPKTDTAPTFDADLSYTAGYRLGTTLANDTDNITLNVGYKQLAIADPTRLRGTGATSRNWCNVLTVFKPYQPQVFDYYGSVIFVGDDVAYDGTTYTVDSIDSEKNIVTLPTVGSVMAVDCEVIG